MTPQPLPQPRATVADQIRCALDRLTPGERKVARALLASYPMSGLGTVAQLAEAAGVSPPTVIRFTARLGYAGHQELQDRLRREAQASLGSPLEQYETKTHPSDSPLLARMAESFTAMVGTSLAEISEVDLQRAVDLLADTRLHVHLLGGRFSHVLATYLATHLQLLRPGVSTFPLDEFSRIDQSLAVNRRDLVVAFDYRRYDMDTVATVTALAKQRASVLLLTDPWLSPAAEVADLVLSTAVDGPSPFDSLVPAFALVESLIAAVAERLGSHGRARLQNFERLRGELPRARK